MKEEKKASKSKSEEKIEAKTSKNETKEELDYKIEYTKILETQKELIGTLQRLQAEFENYKKRVEKEKQEFMKFANSGLILNLLPIVDNFELALKNKDKKDDFIEGTEMIYNEFIKILENMGVQKIDVKGKEFDPYLHQALLQEKSEKENIVLEEFQSGYRFNEKILRPAKVKIGKKE